jgi:glycosyltransferase involved in cell wall biosynthesis
MNETHRGTARSTGIKHLVKKILLKMFDAALVGGSPQREYFHDLGFSDKMLFTGYDAVDNDYFTMRSDEVRRQREKFAIAFGLPKNFILSLGRLISKKNLTTLIRAYRILLDNSEGKSKEAPHLVFVGSGEQEVELKNLCEILGLAISDHSKNTMAEYPDSSHVHFYGFRQIEENPIFYALASVFVLPSVWEEWGLVVNEAMASGIPVIVSKKAGCAPDLIREGVNGFTFDPLDSRDLSLKMRQIVFDKEIISRMGIESRKIISNWGCDNFAQNAMRAAEIAIS